jgi:hypothetical protein
MYKKIALLLPGFHQCPFNNKWWGRGFTEWDIVHNAKPLYPGHIQPKKPIRYYDLLDKNEIQNQYELALSYGIDSFSIYHYWSLGEKPLGRVLEHILRHKDINVNFSLTWANHSWTRSWSNNVGSLDVLLNQRYETTRSQLYLHAKYLATAFADHRYFCTEGKPFLQIYKPESIPNLDWYISNLRQYIWTEYKIDLHIAAMINNDPPASCYIDSFDSITPFNPTLSLFSPEDLFRKPRKQIPVKKFNPRTLKPEHRKILYRIMDLLPSRPRFNSYHESVACSIKQLENIYINTKFRVNPMIYCGFDNTPRYQQRARIIQRTSPMLFKAYLKETVELSLKQDTFGGLIFINAWNEWGEGMALEPSLTDGDAYLSTIRQVDQLFQ